MQSSRSNSEQDIRDGREHALVNAKYQSRNTGGTHGWLSLYVPESKVPEVTNVSVGAVAEGERVAPEPPLKPGGPINGQLDGG